MIPYFTLEGIPVGGATIYPFGVLMLLGVVAGGATLGREMARRRLRLWPLAIMVFLAWPSAYAAHAAYVLAYAPEMLADGPEVLLLLPFGLSAIGFLSTWVPLSLAAAALAGPRRLGAYADALGIGLLVGWAFGRLGCTVIHDHPGVPTRFPLAVKGICPHGDPLTACHDLGLYELLFTVALLVAVVSLHRWARRPAGLQFALLPLLYAPFRFAVDFLLTVDTPRWAGLTPMQWFALPMFLVGLAALALAWWTRGSGPPAGEGSPATGVGRDNVWSASGDEESRGVS